MKATQTALIRKAIQILNVNRTVFTPESANLKLEALRSLRLTGEISDRSITELHEALLFVRTYPDSKQVLLIVDQRLDELCTYLIRLSGKRKLWFEDKFLGSGIAGSTIQLAPSVDLALWLKKHYSGQYKDVTGADLAERIGPVLSLLTLPGEQNGLEHEKYDAHDWLKLAAGKGPFLDWLARRSEIMVREEYVRDHLFETAQPEIYWKLDTPEVSRTGNIIPTKNISYQAGSFQKRDLPQLISEGMPAPRKLRGTEAERVHRSIRSVLAVRSRETDPVTYAQEIYEAIPYPGLSVMLTTMRPSRKLPFENYTGYVAYRNGVPVAYGGGWMFGRRCEFGINVFETFRGGENARLFAGLLKVYRNLCNASKFVVQPYQFGADNEEGLQSGAFWFYYRMGFIPADKTTAKLAATEFKKLLAGKKRTPLSILKKLAEYPVELRLSDDPLHIEPKELSIAVTRNTSTRYQGDSDEALKAASNSVSALLTLSGIKVKQDTKTFTSWAPVIAMMAEAHQWTKEELQQVAGLLQLKEKDELLFSKQFAETDFFRRALRTLK
jgi:hypothetical protein